MIKMSKSLGNHIPLNTTPEDMYGKVMSVPDKVMGEYMRLATRWGPSEIAKIEDDLAAGDSHPRDTKMMLAREIVEIYYGEGAAAEAEKHFQKVFQQGGEPEDMDTFQLSGDTGLIDVMANSRMVSSRSGARRLVKQGGVRLNDEVLEDPNQDLVTAAGGVLRVGKRRFLKLLAADE